MDQKGCAGCGVGCLPAFMALLLFLAISDTPNGELKNPEQIWPVIVIGLILAVIGPVIGMMIATHRDREIEKWQNKKNEEARNRLYEQIQREKKATGGGGCLVIFLFIIGIILVGVASG